MVLCVFNTVDIYNVVVNYRSDHGFEDQTQYVLKRNAYVVSFNKPSFIVYDSPQSLKTYVPFLDKKESLTFHLPKN